VAETIAPPVSAQNVAGADPKVALGQKLHRMLAIDRVLTDGLADGLDSSSAPPRMAPNRRIVLNRDGIAFDRQLGGV